MVQVETRPERHWAMMERRGRAERGGAGRVEPETDGCEGGGRRKRGGQLEGLTQ